MSAEIRQSDLRNDNASVMRRVAAGESFTVTVNGRAVADVVPHRAGTGKRVFVPVSDLRDAFDTTLDPASWLTEFARAGDEFDDEPTDPFAAPAR